MKKTLIALGIVAVIILLAYSQRASIAAKLLELGLQARLGADVVETLEDGLHLALCGAGGPMPAPNASGPCVAVVAGDRLFIVDAGTDSPRNLARMGYQTGTVEAVFLTHFHSDHIDGLGELATLRWAGGGNDSPLPVYGPEGVQRIVSGFNEAYAQDFVYRHDHHGNLVANPDGAGLQALPFAKPADGELVTVYEEDELKIDALAVDHSPVDPAVGYRFDYKGRSLLISGDTSKSPNVEKFARGVDLLAHEALAPNLVGMMQSAASQAGLEVMRATRGSVTCSTTISSRRW